MASPVTLLNDIEPRSQWTGDGVNMRFSASWPIRAASDLRLAFGDGFEPDLGYSLEGVNDSDGFAVLFSTPPLSGTIITAWRDGLIERQTDYGQQRAWNATAVNTAEADLTMRLQELRRELNRSVRLPAADPASVMLVPAKATRANRFAKWDADGILTAVDAPSEAVLDFDGLAEAGMLDPTYLAAFDTPDGPRKATVATIGAYLKALALGLPIITASSIGLVGDWDPATNTGTDDAPRLQQAYETLGALSGGATLMLAAQPGKGFYFAGRPRARSSVNTIWLSPVAAAPKAGLSIRGELAAAANGDGFKLTANGVASSTSLYVDTAPKGGGAPSSYFAADDVLFITSLRDSAGCPLQEQTVRVASVDDAGGRLVLADGLNAAFQVTNAHGAYWDAQLALTGTGTEDQTTIRKLVSARLASDGVEGSNILAVNTGDVSRLVAGRWYVLESEKKQSDVAGVGASPGNAQIQRELLCIKGIGESGAGSVRVHRRLSRAYETAYRARLVEITPAIGATHQGAVAVFTATADAGAWPTFEARWAVDFEFASCSVPNTDSFGTRGNGFRADACAGGRFTDPVVVDPKFWSSGEGYGVYLTWCSGVVVRGLTAMGCRHSIVWLGSTDCDAHKPRSIACKLSDFDWHGADEVGCVAYDVEVTGGSVSASSTFTAFAFGNATGRIQPRRCGVQGGTVADYNDPNATCVRFEAGARDCFVEGVTFTNIQRLLYHADLAAAPTFYSERCRVRGNYVNGCASWLGELAGGVNGSTIRTCRKLEISGNTFRGLARLFTATQLADLELRDNDFGEITADASYTYAGNFFDVTGLQVLNNTLRAGARGWKVQNCPAGRLLGNQLIDMVYTGVLDDLGGNDGLVWRDTIIGNAASAGRTTSVITEDPESIGEVILANNTVWKTKPPRTYGRAIVWLHEAVTPGIEVQYAAVPAGAGMQVLFASGTAAAVATALTGTTGTIGNLTVGCDTAGFFYVENRLGSGNRSLKVRWL